MSNVVHISPGLNGVEYREIGGFPGYAIGNDGSAWSAWVIVGCGNRGGFTSRISSEYRELTPTLMKVGYLSVVLRRNGESHRRYIHSLVLEAFTGPRPPGFEACHEDGDRTDNRHHKLRWDTPKGNHADMRLHGTSQEGEKHGQSKLTDDAVREIRNLYMGGVKSTELSERFGVLPATILNVARLESWSHVAVSDEYLQWLSSWSGNKGEMNSGAKLRSADVVEIRKRVANGEQQQALAREFQVTSGTISSICSRRAWKHVA